MVLVLGRFFVLWLGFIAWSIGSYHTPPRYPLLLAHVLIGVGDQRMESKALFLCPRSVSITQHRGRATCGPAFSLPILSILPFPFPPSLSFDLDPYPDERIVGLHLSRLRFVGLSITRWDRARCYSLGVSRIRCIFRLICKSDSHIATLISISLHHSIPNAFHLPAVPTSSVWLFYVRSIY